MNYLKRAWCNVTRKLSKSILLALTFFVIGNFVIIGLGVSSAASEAKVLTRQKMRAVINYEVDYEAYYNYVNDLTEEEQEVAYKNYPYIKADEINKITSDSRVKTLNALTTSIVYSEGFEAVPLGNKAEENSNQSQSCYVDENGQEVCSVYIEPNIKIKANAYPDMIEFADNMYILQEGRMYSEDDIKNNNPVCLITNTLAELNNLKVGDSIKIAISSKSDVDSWLANMGITYDDLVMDLEIIGIFDNTEEADPTAENFDWMSKYDSPENIVLMPDGVYATKQLDLSQKMWDYNSQQYPDDTYYQDPANRPSLDNVTAKSSLTILLNDPLDVDKFVEDFSADFTDQTFRNLDANNDTFKSLSKPLDTLSLFASFIVWLVIINAVIIITLVTALTLKTREYEIGVLLAMGVTKAKIVMQFFVELAIVAILGFTLAVISGSLVAKEVGKKVLDYQVNLSDVQEEKDDNNWGYYGETNYFTDVTLDDIASNYEVKISPIIIAEIYIAGLGIVLVSILIPSFMVMRFNPKRILMSAQ